MAAEGWRETLLHAGATVGDAVASLDRSGLQIVVVVGAGELLVGTVTDGDIRRGLLRGLGLTDPVDAIVQRNPLVVPPQLAQAEVLHVMQANRVRQLPVIADDERRVVGLHVWDLIQAPVSRGNAMVIMAGGEGTRLRPHTEQCPKPMLPIGGKPMLQHIIERARDEGFGHFVLAIRYLGHMIEDYFRAGERFDVRIDYLREEVPLGTGGALGLLPFRPDAPLVVTNGDVLTDIRYGDVIAFHCRYGAAATMAVRAHEWQHPFGVVKSDGVDIVGFEEKPVYRTHVNAGIYVLDPGALDMLHPGSHCDMPTLFERLQAAGERTIAYPMHEPWLDVGRPADLELARSGHAAAP